MSDIAITRVLNSFEDAFCELYENRETKQLLDSWIKSKPEETRKIFKKVLINNGVRPSNFSEDYETMVPTTRGQVLGLIAAALSSLMSVDALRGIVVAILKNCFKLNMVNSNVLTEVLKLSGKIIPKIVASVIAITRLYKDTSLELKKKPRF